VTELPSYTHITTYTTFEALGYTLGGLLDAADEQFALKNEGRDRDGNDYYVISPVDETGLSPTLLSKIKAAMIPLFASRKIVLLISDSPESSRRPPVQD
jgi:hypothetical protein